jgi:sulfite reductase (NADPH) flavoprotein alpha-component
MQMAPYIPEEAPFTPEQRNWLNGFLAGLYSNAAVVTASSDSPRSLKIAVLYASQSGTAEGLARKVVKDLKGKGHIVSLSSLEAYAPATLLAERYAVIVASTYGEGEAPDAVRPFYEQLCLERFPCCENLSYAVLSLGDSSYEHFCKFGIDLDGKLASMAGTRLCERVDCDVDYEDSFEQWKGALYQAFDNIVAAGSARTTPSTSLTSAQSSARVGRTATYSRENPYNAELIEKRLLTADVSSKQTLHLAFDIRDADVSYEAGDACGVIPQNDIRLVEEILHHLNFSGSIAIKLQKGGTATLFDALLNHLQITRLTRKMIEAYATIGQCQPLFNLLSMEQQQELEKYTYDRGLIDLLHDYPGVLRDPADLVAMLPRLAPRLYSISSSPAAHPGEVHTTVSVVRYYAHNRERGGVCSTLLADRKEAGEKLPMYIHPNKRFRLPGDGSSPMIMIGPGTGIAPFRSFLHERRALNHKGKNWLFFGERSAASDFLYREELESMRSDGHLTRLDVAFSRDQQQKVYVQDRMKENGRELFDWLEQGASVYVCGDASRMARDVDAALHTVVEKHGGRDIDAAVEYVQMLKDQHRYHRDVY